MTKKSNKRLISLLLIAILSVNLLVGCSNEARNESDEAGKKVQDITDRYVEQITTTLISQLFDDGEKTLKNKTTVVENASVEQIITSATELTESTLDEKTELNNDVSSSGSLEEDTSTDVPDANTEEIVLLSDNWEDYLGDIKTFVYGLICNELSYKYDVFPAYVKLDSGYEVYGIAYTDYSEGYTNEGETDVIFEAGFMPYVGEIEITGEEFEEGLPLYDVDFNDEKYSFVWSYRSNECTEHCVIYGKYLEYGTDENGYIKYSTRDYVKGECNEELGSLYSYDEARYVFLKGNLDFDNVGCESLASQIDFEGIEEEVNAIIAEQDANFLTVDIESCSYHAQEAIVNYMLSMQEETFLGYNVDELVKQAEELDPLECYQITSEGLMVTELGTIEKTGAQKLATVLVGTGCIIVVAVSMVAGMVTVEAPFLSSAAGAAAGAGIDIFMQVVIENKNVEDLDLRKTAIAAVSGAVSGFLGPYINATLSGTKGFLIDSSLDGIIGGVEQTVNAYLDGEKGIGLAKRFGIGFAIGASMSAAFKAAGKAVGKIYQKNINAATRRLSNDILAKKSAFTKGIKNVATKFSKKIHKWKKIVDSSIFHSEYISEKLFYRQLNRILHEGEEELCKKSIDCLSNREIIDLKGNIIDKKKLKELFDNAPDDTVLAYFKVDDEVVDLKKKNGMVSIYFDEQKYPTVKLDTYLSDDRNKNMEEAADKFLNKFKKDESAIPEPIKKKIKELGRDIESINAAEFKTIIQSSDMVMHENSDLKTITLVTRKLHTVSEGGIAHMGGIGLVKYMRNHMGKEMFERFVSMAATTAVIAVE